MIFEKALDEPKYSSMYAQLCRRISKEGSTLETEGDSRYTFETLLIRVCQDKFVNRSQYSEKIINSPTSDDIEEEERRYIAKQKILGNVKFIGELYKLEILNAGTLHKMLEQLLDKKSRPNSNLEDRCEDMECLCQIFKTCGKQLDTEKSKFLIDQYFANMEHKSNSHKYPPRIRFMLRDIIELRKDGWKPRKIARVEGPVPIQDLSTDEEYIRQQRDLRTRTMENRNSDRNWMDKLPLSLQSMNNYNGTLSMTSSSSLITGPFNPQMNYNSGRDSLMSGNSYRNNNNSNSGHHNHRNHHENNRPMNKYNSDGGGGGGGGGGNKMNHNKMKHNNNNMHHHRQNDGGGPNNHHHHHHMNNQNSYNNNNNNNNNILNNKELAPRFKRNLVTTTTTNSVDDLQMRPAPNSLLFKASNIKPSPQQLPLNSQNRSGTSSPGFASSTVDNLIPPFNSALQMNSLNGKQQSQQSNAGNQSSQSSSMGQQQGGHYSSPALPPSNVQKSNSANNSQPQSPQNNQSSGGGGNASSGKDQQAVTKQGSVEKQKTKKDKGPSRDDVVKRVAQFINESLLEKKFIEKLQASRNVESNNDATEKKVEDSHNNNNENENENSNGHAENGKAEIIEECAAEAVNGDVTKESNIENESLAGEEEISVPSMEDVVKLYYELKVPDKFLKDSNVKILNESLDKGELAQDTAIEFLMALQKDKKLTANQTLEAFRGVINGMSEREKTIPKVTTHVASLLARSMTKKLCKLTDVANFTDNGQHYPLLLLVLQQLHKIVGEDQLVEMFNNSKINLMSNLPECDRTKDRLAEILDDRKLSFLQPLLRIESELWRQIKEDPQPQTFYKWIKDNVDSVRYTDPGFITALMTVLLKYITQESTFPENSDPTKLPEKQIVEAEKKLLISFSRILNAFLNGNLDLQLIAVYALQVFCFNQKFPKGMLLRWFTALYELEIVEEEAFLRWKEDITDDYPGKGKALFQVNSWLTWLQEAESEEEDDE